MNIPVRTKKILGYCLNGISLVSLAFIIGYEWRNDNNVPWWIWMLVFLPSVIATQLNKKGKLVPSDKGK
jgi:uncharacterized membrane-anchored protein